MIYEISNISESKRTQLNMLFKEVVETCCFIKT